MHWRGDAPCKGQRLVLFKDETWGKEPVYFLTATLAFVSNDPRCTHL